MFKGIKGIVVITAAAILVVAIAYGSYTSINSPAPNRQLAAAGDAGAHLRITLDPQQFEGTVREAYEVAEKDPALLVQLHC